MMNRFLSRLAFICAASLFCFGSCSKEDKTPPAASQPIDKTKIVGTWSITKGVFNYYDGAEKLLRRAGIEKNGLNAELWDHSTLDVKDSTFTQTGIVTQDHLPHTGKWSLMDDGKKIHTVDRQWATDWEIVSYTGSVLTIRHRQPINNGGNEKTAEALLELTRE
ncbi:hypothetical protein ACTJJB_22590 [Chitinophaga sp. 22536]|uniref:hypothetical protein n=1 Tax=unclassified Chitinophaga TaxID=2619133 RepID=UPI003F84A4A0